MKGPSEDASEIRTDGTPTAVEGGQWFVKVSEWVTDGRLFGYDIRADTV